jgi:hypothetical protein
VQNYLKKKKQEREMAANIQDKIKKRLSQIKKQSTKLSMWNTTNISN